MWRTERQSFLQTDVDVTRPVDAGIPDDAPAQPWLIARTRFDAPPFAAASAPITLIRAPAGYGKSALLRQWTRANTGNDLRILRVELNAADRGLQLLRRQLVDGGAIIAAGENAGACATRLERGRPVVVMIDGYDLVDEPDDIALLLQLVHAATPPLHVVLSGRRKRHLNFTALGLDGRLRQFGHEEMAFDLDECRMLLQRFDFPLPAEHVAAYAGKLLRVTEGWPMAMIVLLRRLREAKEYREYKIALEPRNADLQDYVRAEILAPLPADSRRFLQKIAVFERFSGDMLNHVLGRDDCWDLIEELEEGNSLIFPTDPSRQWYRLHRVFRASLMAGGYREHALGRVALQKQAAAWLATHRKLHDSVQCALGTGDPDFVVSVVEKAGGWWICAERGVSVIRELGVVPAVPAAEYPGFRLAQIYVLLHDGKYREAKSAFAELNKLTDGFRMAPGGQQRDDLYVNGRTGEMVLQMCSGDLLSLQDIAKLEEILSADPVANVNQLASVAYFKLVAKFRSGDFAQWEAARDEATHYFQKGDAKFVENFFNLYLGMIAMEMGELAEAERWYLSVNDVSEVESRRFNGQILTAQLFGAQVKYERNEIQAARDLLWPLLHDISEVQGWFDSLAGTYQVASALAFSLGDRDMAFDILAEAEKQSQEREMHTLLAVVQAYRAQLFNRAGEPAQAGEILLGAEPIASLVGGLGTEHRNVSNLGAIIGPIYARFAIDSGKPAIALDILKRIERHAHRHGFWKRVARARLLLALAHHSMGDELHALNYLRQALTAIAGLNMKRTFLDEGPAAVELLGILRRAKSGIDRGMLDFADILRNLAAGSGQPADGDGTRGKDRQILSPREMQVLLLLADGYANKDIARSLDISEGTVRTHRKGIYSKFKVNCRAHAIRMAKSAGLL